MAGNSVPLDNCNYQFKGAVGSPNRNVNLAIRNSVPTGLILHSGSGLDSGGSNVVAWGPIDSQIADVRTSFSGASGENFIVSLEGWVDSAAS
jgi:hypothetical protein